MTPIFDQSDAVRAKYEIELALLEGKSRQIFAGDILTTIIERENYELSIEWNKLVFAWWDEERSQSWLVVAYEIAQSEVRLQVTRGMGREKSVLTLRDPEKYNELHEKENLSLNEKRLLYTRLLAELITAKFKGARIERMTAGAGGRRHGSFITGRFSRLVLEINGEKVLVIGVSQNEKQTDIDSIVGAGLIWLSSFNESRDAEQRAKRIWFCLPKDCLQTVVERLTWIDLSNLEASLECFEVDERLEEIRAIRMVMQDELLNAHPRELGWPENTETDFYWRDRIMELAPDSIEVRRMQGQNAECLSINGLVFARVMRGEQMRVEIGVANNDPSDLMTLNEANFDRLKRLVMEIIEFRSSNAPDYRHPFYRLRSEAWLESLLRRDICKLDPGLDARFVYSQIPTWRADERSMIDLLTINHEGRLVVIEIKAAEDPQLPLQGLDYWLRVEQSRLRKEFEKRGLFGGVKIADQPPMLFLVAPRLRFHRTFATVAHCLAPQIEAYRLGINTNWRDGVRVNSKERIN